MVIKMAIFKNLYDSVSGAARGLADKNRKMAQSSRIHAVIAAQQKAAAQAYQSLGRYYVEHLRDPEDAVAEGYVQIAKQAEKRCLQLQQQLGAASPRCATPCADTQPPCPEPPVYEEPIYDDPDVETTGAGLTPEADRQLQVSKAAQYTDNAASAEWSQMPQNAPAHMPDAADTASPLQPDPVLCTDGVLGDQSAQSGVADLSQTPYDPEIAADETNTKVPF